MKVRAVVVGLLLMVAGQLLAATKAEQIDALLTKAHELRQFNGSALVADASGVVFKKGYGYANFEWQIPNAPDVRFRLASITKQFTSMVVMQLVARGKAEARREDHRLSARLPEGHGRPRHDHASPQPHQRHSELHVAAGLLRERFARSVHARGVREEVRERRSRVRAGLEVLVQQLRLLPPRRDHREGHRQAVRGRRAGADLHAARHEDSGYDVTATVLPKRASGYEPRDGTHVNAPYLDMTIPYAAGSLYSTVEDLYLWDRALYTDKLLRDDLKKQLFTPGAAGLRLRLGDQESEARRWKDRGRDDQPRRRNQRIQHADLPRAGERKSWSCCSTTRRAATSSTRWPPASSASCTASSRGCRASRSSTNCSRARAAPRSSRSIASCGRPVPTRTTSRRPT